MLIINSIDRVKISSVGKGKGTNPARKTAIMAANIT